MSKFRETYLSLLITWIFLCSTFVCKAGDVSFSLANGTTGYCRHANDCFPPFIYHGEDCDCDKKQQDDVCCVDSGVSKGKCQEYSDYVYAEDYGAALMSRRSLAKVSLCHNEAVPLVVGGIAASPMEFPHMVAIGYGDIGSVSFMCGGSLISEQHVLTAAHCHTSRELGPARWAKLGALNVTETDDDDAVQDLVITERILHPRYKPPSRYNDIAIFKLENPVRMSGHVRPACLQTDPDLKVSKATATGWGKLNYTESKGSTALMKVQLSLITGSACEDTYKTDVGGRSLTLGVISSQFCAGELEGGKDTCQGDSGGPLQISMAAPFCMYAVLGVTSFGKFCGFRNAPAIYTRVSHYIPWIESVVWP